MSPTSPSQQYMNRRTGGAPDTQSTTSYKHTPFSSDSKSCSSVYLPRSVARHSPLHKPAQVASFYLFINRCLCVTRRVLPPLHHFKLTSVRFNLKVNHTSNFS
ncbi:hypothetical protein GOODEAATRI_014593 [Goodea atripinnis]|uniref:Uncharacterized protein n=1 Tax=Goodea atripinnis TaxID=208336 RepID=A0ABV0N1F4_9TELE